MQRSLMEMLVPFLKDIPPSKERRDVTYRSHVAIFEALLASDAERARQEMREHLSMAYDSLLEDITRPSRSRKKSRSSR